MEEDSEQIEIVFFLGAGYISKTGPQRNCQDKHGKGRTEKSECLRAPFQSLHGSHGRCTQPILIQGQDSRKLMDDQKVSEGHLKSFDFRSIWLVPLHFLDFQAQCMG